MYETLGSPRTNCFALWEERGRSEQKARVGVSPPRPFGQPAHSRSGPPAKIAELEDSSVGVHQQVLGLDVAVTHPLGVDVGQAPEELVHVHLGGAGDGTAAAQLCPPGLQGPPALLSLAQNLSCCPRDLKL